MRIPRVYTKAELNPQSEVTLEVGPSHHLLKVLRMTKGRDVIVFNGDGNQYAATIISTEKKRAKILTNEAVYKPNSSPLHSEVAIGMSKGDRLDWICQKTTELGVNAIYPLFTSRSEIKLDAKRAEKKIDSWQQIIIGACEQSQRNIPPIIYPPMPLVSYLERCNTKARFVMHHRTETRMQDCSPNSVSFLIGPEGGLNDQEISQAEGYGFLPLCLGGRVMRTETAPIAALSIAQFLWGDLGNVG